MFQFTFQEVIYSRFIWILKVMCDDSYDPVEEYYFKQNGANPGGQENWNKQQASQMYARSLQPESLPALNPLSYNKEWVNLGKRNLDEEQPSGKRKRRE
ncbi:uncharacterized protein DI49_3118 [Saccharomyces eubayanus]|nr:hypothetical protein DI49_3118 [Saccharomyces eubayanus]KOG98689.1 hypothetical protein DI49_3118 [Saccharomyces eubayanus]